MIARTMPCALYTSLSSPHAHTWTDLHPHSTDRYNPRSYTRTHYLLGQQLPPQLLPSSDLLQSAIHRFSTPGSASPASQLPSVPSDDVKRQVRKKLERPCYTKASLCFPLNSVLFHYRTFVGVYCVFIRSVCHKNINGRVIYEHLWSLPFTKMAALVSDAIIRRSVFVSVGLYRHRDGEEGLSSHRGNDNNKGH